MAKAKCRASSNLGTASDTYLYSVARSGSLFATIGSDDSLRLFGLDLQPTSTLPGAHKGVACLSAFVSGFTTGGRDGLVRCWDSREEKAAIEITEPKGNGLASIACHEHLIAAGTESAKEGLGDVSVLVYDTRNPSSPLRSYAESHTDTITQLAFNPDLPNILLSGSTDGLISVFDIEQQDEDDALMQVFNPRGAIHCCGFLRKDEAYALTTDEHFSIYKIGDASYADGSSEVKVGDVREKLDCMYVVGMAGARQSPVMAVGHNVNQKLSLVPLDPTKSANFGDTIDLPGAHGEEVVRDLMMVENNRALSCGEDGQVKLWELPPALTRSGDAMELD